MPKRKCKGTTKQGKRCSRYRLDGYDFCIAHAPEDVKASKSFGGSRAGKLGGRPRLPRPSEIAQQLIERNVLALQRPYWRTLGYDVVIGADGPELVEAPELAAKLYGESKEGNIVMTKHDDLGAMMTAAEKLQDRVYGRPKQATEITGADGGPVLLVAPTDATSKSQRAAKLLADLGQVDAAA